MLKVFFVLHFSHLHLLVSVSDKFESVAFTAQQQQQQAARSIVYSAQLCIKRPYSLYPSDLM